MFSIYLKKQLELKLLIIKRHEPSMRIGKNSLGQLQIPNDAIYGINSLRSSLNFAASIYLLRELTDSFTRLQNASQLKETEEQIVLIIQIDLGAPKGRLILPQVQTIRKDMDEDTIVVVTKDKELRAALDN